MTRRTARFALAGAAIVATAALLYERALPFTERVYRRRGTPWMHEPPRAYVLGFELSPTETVIWFFVLGAIGGAVLGVLLAHMLLMSTRVRSIVLGAVAGGAVGLAVSLARPTYCIGGGGGGFDAVFVCPYKWLFGWDAAPIVADAVWAALGVVAGIILGLLFVRLRSAETSGTV